jgi:nucleoside-diphosphate-sugar epimerase
VSRAVAVAVVGANGRVGSAICARLATCFDVVPITRQFGDDVVLLAARAADGVELVINAAGVAHLEHVGPGDLDRLREGNVELPLAIARAALARGVSVLHVSSSKAADPSDGSPYASSKHEADERLKNEFSDAFQSARLGLVVIRPLALLFPPLDAGKVSRLRFLRWWPRVLTPGLRLPVLTPKAFLDAMGVLVDDLVDSKAHTGFGLRQFSADERGTLRDVREAMLRWQSFGGTS